MSKIVCSVCGSDDVQAKVWTKPNENFEKTCDFIDELIAEPADCYCCNCGENQKLVIVDEKAPANNEPQTFHCEECGSTDVMSKSWVLPNQKDKPVKDGIEDEDGWCNECNQNSTIIPRSELMEVVDYWWKHLDNGEDKEVITGLEAENYDPANNYQAFDTACDEVWAAKTDEEKISIWQTLTQREDDSKE